MSTSDRQYSPDVDDFERLPSGEGAGTSKFRNRYKLDGGESDHDKMSLGDFLSRIWAHFGEPDSVQAEGFDYVFRHEPTGVVFTAYAAGSGNAYGTRVSPRGVRAEMQGGEDSDDAEVQDDATKLEAIRAFEALLESTEPADCEIVYDTDFGVYRSGASDGEPFDEKVGFRQTLEHYLEQFEHDADVNDRRPGRRSLLGASKVLRTWREASDGERSDASDRLVERVANVWDWSLSELQARAAGPESEDEEPTRPLDRADVETLERTAETLDAGSINDDGIGSLWRAVEENEETVFGDVDTGGGADLDLDSGTAGGIDLTGDSDSDGLDLSEDSVTSMLDLDDDPDAAGGEAGFESFDASDDESEIDGVRDDFDTFERARDGDASDPEVAELAAEALRSWSYASEATREEHGELGEQIAETWESLLAYAETEAPRLDASDETTGETRQQLTHHILLLQQTAELVDPTDAQQRRLESLAGF